MKPKKKIFGVWIGLVLLLIVGYVIINTAKTVTNQPNFVNAEKDCLLSNIKTSAFATVEAQSINPLDNSPKWTLNINGKVHALSKYITEEL